MHIRSYSSDFPSAAQKGKNSIAIMILLIIESFRDIGVELYDYRIWTKMVWTNFHTNTPQMFITYFTFFLKPYYTIWSSLTGVDWIEKNSVRESVKPNIQVNIKCWAISSLYKHNMIYFSVWFSVHKYLQDLMWVTDRL